ncbi:hypothetical protein [Streptomyces sp. PTY087I2]|uniref:hypothetical protein n=1 Tax=Streptomyces sp. PTY087I2 TaxID=1819298 RepID=UPI000828E3CB|nr:hypothetical protein [Streptomyces sp. PTY087I2]OCC10513.1 hypothetical protein A3Q37_03673 [Streptomyces sp. PTY087I2]
MASLPPLVLPDSESFEATVGREDLITFGEQSSILTRPAKVCAVFSLPGRDHGVRHRDRHYLDVMHKHTA